MEPLGPRKGTHGMDPDPPPHADKGELEQAIARGGPRDARCWGSRSRSRVQRQAGSLRAGRFRVAVARAVERRAVAYPVTRPSAVGR
jgi:hypothetical protein